MPNMRCIESSWNDKKTFKLIPITSDCPFVEGIFDMESKVLVLIGLHKKQTFHMIPRLTDEGDIMLVKNGKRENGKKHKEERKALDTFQEYYLETKQDILDFINTFADNADKFKIEPYFVVTSKGFNQEDKAEMPKILTSETIKE